MKRRLPTINQGGFVLVAINIAPHAADTNRHIPSGAHPGSPAAASHAAAIAASAQPSKCRPGPTTDPPNSTASAANATAKRSAPALNRRHHPLAVL